MSIAPRAACMRLVGTTDVFVYKLSDNSNTWELYLPAYGNFTCRMKVWAASAVTNGSIPAHPCSTATHRNDPLAAVTVTGPTVLYISNNAGADNEFAWVGITDP